MKMGILGIIIKIILMVLVIGGVAFSINFLGRKKGLPKNFRFLGLMVILTVILALFLLALMRFGNVFAAIWLFEILTDKLNSITGWNLWLVRSITILLTLVIAGLVSKFVISFDKKRRQLGYSLLAILAALMCLGIFGLTKDNYFDYQTGEAQKWYAITNGKYCVFDSPGHDPKTGVELQLVTPNIQRQIERWQKNPNPVKIETDEKTVFFDMITGEPVLWYYQLDNNGDYEFFDKPGTHPVYGKPLQPVTSEVAEKAMARVKELKVKKEDNPDPVIGSEATGRDWSIRGFRQWYQAREVKEPKREIWRFSLKPGQEWQKDNYILFVGQESPYFDFTGLDWKMDWDTKHFFLYYQFLGENVWRSAELGIETYAPIRWKEANGRSVSIDITYSKKKK